MRLIFAKVAVCQFEFFNAFIAVFSGEFNGKVFECPDQRRSFLLDEQINQLRTMVQGLGESSVILAPQEPNALRNRVESVFRADRWTLVGGMLDTVGSLPGGLLKKTNLIAAEVG